VNGDFFVRVVDGLKATTGEIKYSPMNQISTNRGAIAMEQEEYILNRELELIGLDVRQERRPLYEGIRSRLKVAKGDESFRQKTDPCKDVDWDAYSQHCLGKKPSDHRKGL